MAELREFELRDQLIFAVCELHLSPASQKDYCVNIETPVTCSKMTRKLAIELIPGLSAGLSDAVSLRTRNKYGYDVFLRHLGLFNESLGILFLNQFFVSFQLFLESEVLL